MTTINMETLTAKMFSDQVKIIKKENDTQKYETALHVVDSVLHDMFERLTACSRYFVLSKELGCDLNIAAGILAERGFRVTRDKDTLRIEFYED